MSAAAKITTTEEAWRHCAKLTAAIAQGRHNCSCGSFGPFKIEGRWYCRSHVERDANGSFSPNPDAARAAIIAGRRSTDEAQDEHR